MSLWTRLMGLSPPKIPIHAFDAMVSERKRGLVTAQQIIDAFSLSAGEQTELATLWTRVDTDLLQAGELNHVLICAEARLAPYDTEAEVKARLGV